MTVLTYIHSISDPHNALTCFYKTASHPDLVFVQLIILIPVWTVACAVIRLHPVLSGHFSILFSSS